MSCRTVLTFSEYLKPHTLPTVLNVIVLVTQVKSFQTKCNVIVLVTRLA